MISYILPMISYITPMISYIILMISCNYNSYNSVAILAPAIQRSSFLGSLLNRLGTSRHAPDPSDQGQDGSPRQGRDAGAQGDRGPRPSQRELGRGCQDLDPVRGIPDGQAGPDGSQPAPNKHFPQGPEPPGAGQERGQGRQERGFPI